MERYGQIWELEWVAFGNGLAVMSPKEGVCTDDSQVCGFSKWTDSSVYLNKEGGRRGTDSSVRGKLDLSCL